MSRVAIIGAGIAGLTAAQALTQSGFDVVVWDKGARPGGRASSRLRDDFEFDHGAQYFTARGRPFRLIVENWIEQGVVVRWSPRVRVFPEGERRTSGERAPRYVGTPRMSVISAALARGLDVRSGVRIARLQRDRGREWSLRGESGRTLHRADVVLVTVPPAQAVPLLKSAPELAERADRVAMRPCWAVMLGFDRTVDVPFDAAFVNEGALSWVARNSSKPGRRGGETWVLHGSPEWSARHLDVPREEISQELIDEFCQRCELPGSLAPVHTEAHRWRWATPDPPLDALSLYDEERRLGAGGDWCGGPRIEGAYASGTALAERVMNKVREKTT